MLSACETAGFLNQLYHNKKLMIQLDFWHDDVDSKNIRNGLKIFSWVWSKELSASQISWFLNQLYLNPLSAYPGKCSNTLKQLFDCVWSFLWGWHWKGSAWLFACWKRLKEYKMWFENFSWVCQKCRILESTIMRVRTDESTWFLTCIYRSKKTKGGL